MKKELASFRARILSALAAAGVAQACGGTVTDGAGEEGGDDSPVAGEEGGDDSPVAAKPGCLPVFDATARLAQARFSCAGSVPSCNATEALQCFGSAELARTMRECATPLDGESCPAPDDLAPAERCLALTGDGERRNELCCYPVTRLSCAVPGRLLRVNGSICLPDVIEGAPLPCANEPDLDAASRRALAELWCEGGRYEHASVAAFARITLQLLALGAPPGLVAASMAAAMDELEHARLCFALASRFAGRELRPGRLPVPEAALAPDLTALAIETVIGGCVGETVAALTATAQLGAATDAEVRFALEQIAQDEARHAELAWRILAWTLSVGGEGLRSDVARAFEVALAERSGPSPEAAAPCESHGQLGLTKERALHARILREVVTPAARVLVAA